MNRRSIVTLTAMASLGLCTAGAAQADETLKFRVIQHATAAQTQEVGDVDGHTMTVVSYSGLASLADGSVGTINFTGTTDYIKGSGTFTGYFKLTLKDGSTITYKGTNIPARLEGTTTNFSQAPFSIQRGTGRFDGAKGDGAGSGARLTPLTAGAEVYYDFVLDVKK
jgi:hypothetical protein